MGKYLFTNDSLPFRHRSATGLSNELRQFNKPARINRHGNMTGVLECHYDLFERGITSPFTEAVDGRVNKPCAGSYARDGIGRSHTQVIMGMNLQVQVDTFGQIEHFVVGRERIKDAECIAEPKAVSALIPGYFHQLHQKIKVGTTGIFATNRDIQIMTFGKTERNLELFLNPVSIFAKLSLDMNIRNRKGNINRANTAVDRGLNI